MFCFPSICAHSEISVRPGQKTTNISFSSVLWQCLADEKSTLSPPCCGMNGGLPSLFASKTLFSCCCVLALREIARFTNSGTLYFSVWWWWWWHWILFITATTPLQNTCFMTSTISSLVFVSIDKIVLINKLHPFT